MANFAVRNCDIRLHRFSKLKTFADFFNFPGFGA